MILRIVIVAAGYLLAVPLCGKLIQWCLSRIGAEDELKDGLKNAGMYIGWLERFLVLTFVLLDQISSIGFLIAAKSVFRIGEVRERSQRRLAEYILIGTLFSFSASIAIGCLMNVILGKLAR